jgi:integrase
LPAGEPTEPSAIRGSPRARATAVLPAAGTVVTEINTPMSAPDLAAVSDRMPAIPARNATTKENASGRALVLVDAWLGLRWGEATELRGGYLDLDAGVAHVGRGVVRTAGGGKDREVPEVRCGH